MVLRKRGNFYPFAPLPEGTERRDNALELQQILARNPRASVLGGIASSWSRRGIARAGSTVKRLSVVSGGAVPCRWWVHSAG